MSSEVRVLMFASLADAAGIGAFSVSWSGGSVQSFIEHLNSSHPQVFHAIQSRKSLLIAINQLLVNKDATIRAGDEIAFMPPVTGG